MLFSAFFQRLGEENPPLPFFLLFGVFVLFLFYPLYTSLIIFIRMCDESDEGDEERYEQVYNTDYQVWQDGGTEDSYKVWQDDGSQAPFIFFQTTFGYPVGGYKVFEDGTVHFKSVDGSAEKVVPDSYIAFADAEEHDGYPLPTVTLYTNCSGPGWARTTGGVHHFRGVLL